jgi:hypothetical protein
VAIRFKTAGGKVTFLARCVSALALALLALLMLGSVSPTVHDHFCHHDSDGDADHCVMMAFAAGEIYAPPMQVPVAPVEIWIAGVKAPAVAGSIAAMVERLLPACGPPQSGEFV